MVTTLTDLKIVKTLSNSPPPAISSRPSGPDRVVSVQSVRNKEQHKQ